MTYKLLGNSDLQVSRLAFGCMSLKGNETENISLLRQAIDQGINLFDTADLYDQGGNEILVGRALKEKRKEIFIATKVGNQWRSEGSGWDWNPTKDYILEAAEESLRRLQTDYIDLYQLHGGTTDDPTDETIEAFEILKEQGKIRHYGISSIRPNVIRRWLDKANLTSVMVQYSLLDRRPEEHVLPKLRHAGIGVLVRGALAQGLLLGKPPKPYLEHDEASVKAAAATVNAANKKGQTPTAASLHFALQHPAVTAAVVGIRTGQQLQEAIDGVNSPVLDAATYSDLCDAAPAHQYLQHRN